MGKKRPCCVPGCSDKLSVRHRFPLRDENFRAWLHRIRNPKLQNLDKKKVYDTYLVCDVHFNEECKNAGSKSLKIYSVPSLLLPDFNEESTKENSFLRPSDVKGAISKDDVIAPLNPVGGEDTIVDGVQAILPCSSSSNLKRKCHAAISKADVIAPLDPVGGEDSIVECVQAILPCNSSLNSKHKCRVTAAVSKAGVIAPDDLMGGENMIMDGVLPLEQCSSNTLVCGELPESLGIMAQPGNGDHSQELEFATRVIHVGQDPDQWSPPAAVPPIILATSFKLDGSEEPKFDYTRSGNPNRTVLEQCLASIESAKYALTFSSGLGAIMAVTQLLNAGDHIISSDDIYGGTNRLFTKITCKMNIETTFVDARDAENVRNALRPNTKLVWLESPTNPLMKILDINAVAEVTRSRKGVLLVVDNTFLTPYFQRPLELGADVAMYSITKYLNGHSDILMGSLTTNNDQLYEELKFIQKATGIVPSPFCCYMVNRSLKTLALRMREHMKNALEVAHFLESHPFVEKVLHPGLPSHPQYELSLRQSCGYSGTFSFYLKEGGLKESKVFLKALKLFTFASSLGGFHSLAEIPSIMSHASVALDQRIELGITDAMIRLSVGLESPKDLICDLKQALLVAAEQHT